MYTRILTLPNSSFFLFGVRGTGKTTWLKKHFINAHWFNLLDESLYQKLLVSPEHFYNQLRVLAPNTWVIVDEVQRLPNLLNEVHRAIEELELNFALTGSSARKLKRAGINLLAGRARLRSMFPLFPSELKSDYNLDKILEFGSIPLIWNSNAPSETLKDYVQLYLKQEIQAEAIVRNLAGFARSLPVLALYNAQIQNISSASRDAEIERKTLEGYLEILEDTLMIKRLYPYQAKITVREKKKAKIYWVDTGVARAAKGVYGTITPEERGHLLESYIFQIIRHYIENERIFDDVYYWSPAESKTEVDFLLKKGEEFYAIEVKATSKIKPSLLKGLQAIKSLKNIKKRVLVYTGKEKQKTSDGILILPITSLEEELLN